MADSPRPRPARREERVRRRRLVVALAASALVVGGLTGYALRGDGSTSPAGVTLDGREVGGLSRPELVEAVRDRAAELRSVPITITRSDDPSVVVQTTRGDLGARPRVRRAVEAALEPRGMGGRILALVGLAPEREVPVDFTLDQSRVSAVIERVRNSADVAARPAGLQVTPDDISVVPGRPGRGIDARALRARIQELPERIEATPVVLEPPVSGATAEAARTRALALIASPVGVALQGRAATIEPTVLRAALRVAPRGSDLEISLDPDVLYADIASAYASREQPARDAEFRISGSSVKLIPSRIGRSLDMPAIAQAIVDSPGAPTVRARFKVTPPARTTRQARALRITELIAEFGTPYNCCEPRVTNIQRAAEILDGTIIPAGGRFSLNEALGERTLERGFVSAPQIAAGRLEEAVGGGVSQVATTMFNTAFFAGLQIVTHTPHQFWISRYPRGREATVSYGGPELIFVNDWPAAVLISAGAGSNGITIRFFSSRLGRRITTETGEPTDIVEPTTRETLDRSLKPGERVVEQEMGGSGFTISYTRAVYEGTRVKRDERYTWSYDAQDAFVKVGPPKRPTPRGAPDEPDAQTAPTPPDGPPPATTGGGAAPPPPP